MGRRVIIVVFLSLIFVVSAAVAADSLQGSVAVWTRIASGITEPIGMVLGGIAVIGCSWLVRRKLSKMRD